MAPPLGGAGGRRGSSGGAAAARRRRRRPRWLTVIFVLVLVVPVVEIAAIIAVGKVIGAWPTVALLVLESLLGAWVVRHEGARAWRALTGALHSGQMPSRELADAALVLVGGTLLLTPGFVTDVVGFFFILPFTRPLARGFLEAAVARRLLATMPRRWGGGGGPRGPGGRGGGPDVVEGEVL